MPLLSYPVRQPWEVHLNLDNRDAKVLTGLSPRDTWYGEHYRLGAWFGAVIATDLGSRVKLAIVS
jgi:hypothetical protein